MAALTITITTKLTITCRGHRRASVLSYTHDYSPYSHGLRLLFVGISSFMHYVISKEFMDVCSKPMK